MLSFHDIVIFIYQFRIRAGQALPFRLEASSFGVTIRDHSTGYWSGENTGTRKYALVGCRWLDTLLWYFSNWTGEWKLSRPVTSFDFDLIIPRVLNYLLFLTQRNHNFIFTFLKVYKRSNVYFSKDQKLFQNKEFDHDNRIESINDTSFPKDLLKFLPLWS